MKRRDFLASTTAAAGMAIIPREILGSSRTFAPNEKLNVACIGTGTQGIRVILELLKIPEIQIVAVADPVKEDTRYLNWGKHELRNNIREAIEEPTWDEGVTGCRAGREPAKRIVEAWYGKQKKMKYKDCAVYEDFREMLEKEKGIDAVVIGAPDHQHAYISVKCMEKGKHVYCQKPMTNSIYEARLLANKATETKLATQVATLCSSSEDTDALCEMIWSGAIGPVREVHNWSNRPVWPSGFIHLPA